ncbi:MAG: hypothetical protein U9N07_09330 [Euryarchaeota archaeon]|nr:hypothetical protein [Euryarchaeota archaeon]
MFILNVKQFGEFDFTRAKQFVDYWSKQYSYDSVKAFDSDEVIDYIDELNLGNNLSEQNVKRLLRWKDHRMLTEKILSGPRKGSENKKVLKVIEKREQINKFRRGEIGVNDFKNETEKIFPNGFVWRIFLFHIARPFEYPLADQNVFRAFSTQKLTKTPEDWDGGYQQYRDYFFQIAISSGIIVEKPKGHELDIKEIVKRLKRVDDALFAFGQFLSSYGGENDLPHST